MILWTSSASAGERTNDSAIMSTRSPSAKRRSASSFSLIAGTETTVPGSEMPLWSETRPPSTTRHTTSRPSTSVTSSETLPSSISSDSPGRTSSARPG